MKSLSKCFLLLIIVPWLLSADTIYMRDGQVFENVEELREFENIFLFQRNSRSISVPKERIQRIVGDNGSIIYELLLRTMKERGQSTNTVIFDFFINGEKVSVGEWFEEGKFHVIEGQLDSGTYLEYYPSGRVKREYTVSNGTLNGPCKEFYASGIPERESTMKNGLENGVSKNYHQSGRLKGEAIFKDGEKDGETRLYYESGNVRSIMNFSDGRVVGNQQVLYESGQVEVEVNFVDGIKDGAIKQYYDTGNIKMEGTFRRGVLEGEVVNYYESGRVKERLFFRNGRIIEN